MEAYLNAYFVGIVVLGFVVFYLYASWVDAGKQVKNQVQITVVLLARRSQAIPLMLIRQFVTSILTEHLGQTGLEFIDHQSAVSSENTAYQQHHLVFLMPTALMGVQPIGKLQKIQWRIAAKGFPCAVLTDPDVGSA